MSQLDPITNLALTDSPFPPDDGKVWQTSAKTSSGIYIWESREAKAGSITAVDVVYEKPEVLPDRSEWISLGTVTASKESFGLLITKSSKSSTDSAVVKIGIVKEEDRVGGANWTRIPNSITTHTVHSQNKIEGAKEYLRYQTLAMLKMSEKSQYNVGDWVDAMDTRGVWCVAIIRDIDKGGKRALIHYEGWADKWDIKVDLKSGRIAPYRTHTKGETGWAGNARGYQLSKFRNEFNSFLKECNEKVFEPMRSDASWHPPTTEDIARTHSVKDSNVSEFARLETEMCKWVLNLTNCVVPDPSYLPLVSSFFAGFLTYFARALTATIDTQGAIRKELLQAATACFGTSDKGEQMFFGKYGVTDQLDEDLAKYCKGEYAVRPPVSEKPSSAYYYKNVNVFGDAGGFRGLVERFSKTLDVCKVWVRGSASVENKSSAQPKDKDNCSVIPDAVSLIPSYLVLLSALSKSAKHEVIMETVHQMNVVELLPWRFAALTACPVEAREFDPNVALKLLESVAMMLKPFVSSDSLLEHLERSRLVLALTLATSSSALLLQLAGVRILVDMINSSMLLPSPCAGNCKTPKLCILNILERTSGSWSDADLVILSDNSINYNQKTNAKNSVILLLSPRSQYSANFLCSAIVSSGLFDKLLETDTHLQLFALTPGIFDFIAKCGILDANRVFDALISRLLLEHVSSLPYVLNVLHSFSQSLLQLISAQDVKVLQLTPGDCTKAAFASLHDKKVYSSEELLQAAFCERPILHAGSALWLRLNNVCMKNLRGYEGVVVGEAQGSAHNGINNLLHPDVLSCLQRVSSAWIPSLIGYIEQLSSIVNENFPLTAKSTCVSSALLTLCSEDANEHPYVTLTRVGLCMTPLLWQLSKLQSIDRAKKAMSEFSLSLPGYNPRDGSGLESEEMRSVGKACMDFRGGLSAVPKSHEVLIEMIDLLRVVECTRTPVWNDSIESDPENLQEAKTDLSHTNHNSTSLGDQLRGAMVQNTVSWLSRGTEQLLKPSKEILECVTFDMLASLVCRGNLKCGRQILASSTSHLNASSSTIDLWGHLSELRSYAVALSICRLSELFSNEGGKPVPETKCNILKVEASFLIIELAVRSAVFHELASEETVNLMSDVTYNIKGFVLKTSHISDIWKAVSSGKLFKTDMQLVKSRFYAWVYRVLLKSAYIATPSAPPVLRSVLGCILESYQNPNEFVHLSRLEFRCIEIIFSVLNTANVIPDIGKKKSEEKHLPPIITSFNLRDSYLGESKIISKCRSLSDLRRLLHNFAASSEKIKNVAYSNTWVIETCLMSSRESAPYVAFYDAIEEVNFFRGLTMALASTTTNQVSSDILSRAIDSCVSLVVNTATCVPIEERKRLVNDMLNWCCAYLEIAPEEKEGKYSATQKENASLAALALHTLLGALRSMKTVKLIQGDTVYATWKAKRKLYPARVKEVNLKDLTCCLLYDDGTFDNSVPIQQVCDEKTAKSVNYAIEQPVDFSACWTMKSSESDDLAAFASQFISKSKQVYDTLLALGESKTKINLKDTKSRALLEEIELIEFDQRSKPSLIEEDIEKAIRLLLETLPPPVSLRNEVLAFANIQNASWEKVLPFSNIPRLTITLQTILNLLFSYGNGNQDSGQDLVVDLNNLGDISSILRELCPKSKSREGTKDDFPRVANVSFIAKMCASGGLEVLSNLLFEHLPQYFSNLQDLEEYEAGQYDSCIQLIDSLTGILLVAHRLFFRRELVEELEQDVNDYTMDVLKKAKSITESIRNHYTGSIYDSCIVLLEACLTTAARKFIDGNSENQGNSNLIHSASRSTSRLVRILISFQTSKELTLTSPHTLIAHSSHRWIRLLSMAPFAASAVKNISAINAESTPFVADLMMYLLKHLDRSLDSEHDNFASNILTTILTATFIICRSCAMIATVDLEGVRKMLPYLFSSRKVRNDDFAYEPLDRLSQSLYVAAERHFSACIRLLHIGMARCNPEVRIGISGLWLRVLSVLIRSHPPLETFSSNPDEFLNQGNKQNQKSNSKQDQQKYDFVLNHLLSLVTEVLLAAGSPLATEDNSNADTFVQLLRDLRSLFALDFGVLAHLLGPGLFLINVSPVVSCDTSELSRQDEEILPRSADDGEGFSFGKMMRVLSVSSIGPSSDDSISTEVSPKSQPKNSTFLNPDSQLSSLLSDLENPEKHHSENQFSLVNPLPQCKSPITRQAAFRLIWFLISDDTKCIDFALQRIAIIHSVRPQAGSDVISFNFAPTVPPRVRYSAPAGIRNLGATCFANSVLQQICSIPDFVEGLLMIATDLFFSDINVASGDALYQLQRLALSLIATDEAFYNPRAFFRSNFKMEGQRINTSRQEDAEGFLQSLLDTVDNHPIVAESRRTASSISAILKEREDVLTCDVSPQNSLYAEEKSSPDAEKSPPNGEEFALMTKQQLDEKLQAAERISKVVSSVFRIESVDRFDASGCGHRREGVSNLWSIPVEVLGKNSLEAALASTTAVEMVNDLRCSQCNGKERTTAKRFLIKNLPKVLVVVLKRFTMDYDTFQTVKLSHRVSFPTTLDMYPYTTSAINAEIGEKLDSEQQLSRDNCLYNLKGVILHRGEISHGHYISYLRCGDQSAEQSWVCADDHMVYPWDIELNLETDCFGGEMIDKTTGIGVENTQSAYVLVYDKTFERGSDEKSFSMGNSIAPPSMTLLSRRTLGGKSLLHAPLSLTRSLAHMNVTYARDKLVFEPSHFAFLDRLLRSQVVDLAFKTVHDRPYPFCQDSAFVNVVNLINDPNLNEYDEFKFESTQLELGSDLSIAFSSYCMGLRFLLQTLARASIDLAPTSSDIASVERTAVSVGAVANILASPTSTTSRSGTDVTSLSESDNNTSGAIASVIDTKKSRNMELFDESVRNSAISSRTFRGILARLQVWFSASKRPFSSTASPGNSFNENECKATSPRHFRTEANVLRNALSIWILRETISQKWHRDILLVNPDYELRAIFCNFLWEAYLNLLAIERQQSTIEKDDANLVHSPNAYFRSLKFAFVDSLLESTNLLNAHWNKAGSMLQLLNRIVSYSAQPCLISVEDPIDFSNVRGNVILDKSVLHRVLSSGLVLKLVRLITDGCTLPFCTSANKSWASNPSALPSPGAYHSWTRVTTLLAIALEFCSGLPCGPQADSRIPLHILSDDERQVLLARSFISRALSLCTSPADTFPIMRILCRTHLLGNEPLSKTLISAIIGGIDESGDGNLRSHLRIWNLVARFDDTTFIPAPSFGFPLRIVAENMEQKGEIHTSKPKHPSKESIELVVEGKRILIEADADDDTFLILTQLSRQDAGGATSLSNEHKQDEVVVASLQIQRAKLLVTGLATILNQRKLKYWRFTERCLEHLYRAIRLSAVVANAAMAQAPSSSTNGNLSLLPWAADWLKTYGDNPPNPGPKPGLELCKPMDTEAYARSAEMDHVQVQTLVATVAACDSQFIKENVATGMPGGPFWRNQWFCRGRKNEDRIVWYSALSHGAISFLQLSGMPSSYALNEGCSRKFYFMNPKTESTTFSIPTLDSKLKNSNEQMQTELFDAEQDSDEDDIDDISLFATGHKSSKDFVVEETSDSDIFVDRLGRCQIAQVLVANGPNLVMANTNSKWRLDSAADVHQRYSAVCRDVNVTSDDQAGTLLALSIGMYLDVRDQMSAWRPGKIEEIYNDEIGHQHAIIRFLGFSKESNEDVILTSGRVAKLGQYSRVKLKQNEQLQESLTTTSAISQKALSLSDQHAKSQLLLQRARYPFAQTSPILLNNWAIAGRLLTSPKSVAQNEETECMERSPSVPSKVGFRVGLY